MNKMCNLALNSGTELHFADENLILRTAEDLDYIQKVLNFSRDTSAPEV
jgi:hypothetical protein